MRPGIILDHKLCQRSAVRYKLRLPVIFRWTDGYERTGAGFTSDVALDGALIVSSSCPQMGVEVFIEILLPSPDGGGQEFRIECIGKVTRISRQPGYTAFGVHGTFDDDHLTRLVLM